MKLTSIRWTIIGIACVVISSGSTATASTIDILLSPDGGGGTLMTISGSGADHNGTNDGLGASSQWSNLEGGDPFDIAIENMTFGLATPLAFSGSVNLISMTFDHDGASGSEFQDDFTIGLSDLFNFDLDFFVSGSTVLTGLDFNLLNPGTYTRENSLADLTLTIAPVPIPAPILMIVMPLLFLVRKNLTFGSGVIADR